MEKGDKVRFGRDNGEKTLGEVVKVNRSTIMVKQLESRGTMKAHPVGTVWRVRPSLCTPADGTMAPEVQARLKAGQDRDFAFLRGERLPVMGQPAVPRTRTEAAIMSDILGAYCELSPENLTCDGELSGAHVRRRAAALRARLQLLFREVGRTVSEDEAYKHGFAQYRSRRGV